MGASKILVVDTTALAQVIGLQSRDWRRVRALVADGRVSVIFSEVVVRETIAKHLDALDKSTSVVAEGLSKLKRAGIADPREYGEVEFGEVAAAEYASRLRGLLVELGRVVEPPETLSHLDLVDRAIGRLSPFNNSGAGYRDALIFEAVIHAAKSSEVIFVSQNHTDFAEGRPDERGRFELAKDLVNVLESHGVDAANVSCYADLAAMVRVEFGALLEGLDSEAEKDSLFDLLTLLNSAEFRAQALRTIAPALTVADLTEIYSFDEFVDVDVHEIIALDDVSEFEILNFQPDKTNPSSIKGRLNCRIDVGLIASATWERGTKVYAIGAPVQTYANLETGVSFHFDSGGRSIRLFAVGNPRGYVDPVYLEDPSDPRI